MKRLILLLSIVGGAAFAQVAPTFTPYPYQVNQGATPNAPIVEEFVDPQNEDGSNRGIPDNLFRYELFRINRQSDLAEGAVGRFSYYDGTAHGWTGETSPTFPLLPPGATCPKGGTWPNCTDTVHDASGTTFNHFKLGSGQQEGAVKFHADCRGPGDCINSWFWMTTWQPTPRGGDEPNQNVAVRTFDYPYRVPQGTIDAAITPGSTSMISDFPWQEVGRELGDWSLVVFKGASQAVNVVGGDGAGTGTGGFNDFDITRARFIVNSASEIPSDMRRDATVGHTGYCVALNKSEVHDKSGVAYKPWLLVRSGPGDQDYWGNTLSSTQFEVYAPGEGYVDGGIPALIPGTVWTDWVRNLSTDDGILAPCEIASRVEMTFSRGDSRPVGTVNSTAHHFRVWFKNPSMNRTIANGTSWEAVPIGHAYEFQGISNLIGTKHRNNATGYYGKILCDTYPNECGEQSEFFKLEALRARAATTNGPTDSGTTMRRGIRFLGPLSYGAFSYQPGQGEAELSATVVSVVHTSDWGTSAADRVKLEQVQLMTGTGQQLDGKPYERIYDSVDNRPLISRTISGTTTITQQVEVKTDPIVYYVPAGSRTCNNVCTSNKLVCDSWKAISTAGALTHQTDCDGAPTEQGAYCHCDSPELP